MRKDTTQATIDTANIVATTTPVAATTGTATKTRMLDIGTNTCIRKIKAFVNIFEVMKGEHAYANKHTRWRKQYSSGIWNCTSSHQYIKERDQINVILLKMTEEVNEKMIDEFVFFTKNIIQFIHMKD